MGALVPYGQYQIAVGGATYPARLRKEESVNLPEVLKAVEQHSVSQLMIPQMRKKTDIFAAYAKSVDRLDSEYVQFQKMLVEVVKANIAKGTDASGSRQVVERFENWLGKTRYHAPPALRADVAIKEPQEIVTQLNEGIRRAVSDQVEKVHQMLDGLVDVEQVGLNLFLDPHTCQFSFFSDSYDLEDKYRTLDTKREDNGRFHKETKTVETTTTRTTTHVRHQHDLVDVQPWSLKDAFIPIRLREVAKALPSSYEPFARVLTGKQIFEGLYEEVFTKTTKTVGDQAREWTDPPPRPAPRERTVYRYDPAIVLGQYVLGGWGPEEEQIDRQVEKELKKRSGSNYTLATLKHFKDEWLKQNRNFRFA